MKHIIRIFAVFMLINMSATAQSNSANSPAVIDLKVKVENDQIFMNWTSKLTKGVNYWEVQASKDGEEFYTIGLVLGPDPAQMGEQFMFKQKLNKMKPGLKYFRVFEVKENGSLSFTPVIRLTK